ncbi:MAG: hypothetical protein WKG32_19090 [Gemmatimonadaceae bacterium]
MARQRSAQSGADQDFEAGPRAAEGQQDQQDQWGQAPGTGSQGAGVQGAVDDAKEKARQLAGQAQQKAGEQVQSGLARGKTRAAETLGGVAQSLHATSQQLREQNQERPGRYIEQAAGRVEQLSNYLHTADVHQIVDEVEDFARRQPALFLGGAFVVGVLGARFFKSSRRSQEQGVPRHRAVVPYDYGSDAAVAGSPGGRGYGGGYGVEREADSLRTTRGLADRAPMGGTGAGSMTGAGEPERRADVGQD